jgi:hypothetical protein
MSLSRFRCATPRSTAATNESNQSDNPSPDYRPTHPYISLGTGGGEDEVVGHKKTPLIKMSDDTGVVVAKIVFGVAGFAVFLYLAISRGGTIAILWGLLSGIGLVVAVVEVLKIVDKRLRSRK